MSCVHHRFEPDPQWPGMCKHCDHYRSCHPPRHPEITVDRVPLKRETFGRVERTAKAAARKRGLAMTQGWIDLDVEEVILGGAPMFKLTGIPIMRHLQEMSGKAGPYNEPRVVDSRRRKGQSYRHGGG
jgi:hypothetical protein